MVSPHGYEYADNDVIILRGVEKKKKVIYKRSFVISILTAMILGFRLMHGHVHRFVSRCLSIGIFTSSRAMIILRITKYEMAKLPARVERNIDQ